MSTTPDLLEATIRLGRLVMLAGGKDAERKATAITLPPEIYKRVLENLHSAALKYPVEREQASEFQINGFTIKRGAPPLDWANTQEKLDGLSTLVKP